MDASVNGHDDIGCVWICVTAERGVYSWYGWERGAVYGIWELVYIWIRGCGCGIYDIWDWRICECERRVDI